jgi:hypothetical protein
MASLFVVGAGKPTGDDAKGFALRNGSKRIHRHAEPVPASIVKQGLSAQVDEWMLKQVQHDEVF